MALYLRLAAYAALAALLVGVGWHLGGLGPQRALAQLQAQDWEGKAQAASLALTATQAQLKMLQDTDARNSGVIKELQDANTKTAAERDTDLGLYQRLLQRPAPAHPPGGAAVPQARGGQSAPRPGGDAGGDQAAVLLTDASAECQRNADRLNALIAEVTPQL